MRKISLLIMAILSFTISQAQYTVISDDSTYVPASGNALFEVHSQNGNKGILVPRLTTAERTAMATVSPADNSLLVYDTDTKTFWYWDGTSWVEIIPGGTDDQLLSFSNDTLYIENGNSIYLGDYRELPATAINGQVLTWNGSAWVAQNAASGADNWGSQVVVSDTTLSGDGSSGNPLTVNGDLTDDQTLNLSSNTLSISGGNSVDLSGYLDNTDNQGLSLSGDSLNITNGSGVDLSAFMDNTDDQNLTGATLTGTTLQIDIENGSPTSVDLSSLQDGTGTDDQNLSLSGNTLSIENGNSVDLSSFMDNTDNQTLSLSGNTLSISGGNSVDLSGYGNDWKLSGNAAASSDFIGTTNAIDFRMFTNNTERMTIKSNGNVGIGTTAPASKLQVTGGTRIIYSTSPTLYLQNDANSSSNYALQIQSQGGTRSWIASNGRGYFADRVGIGTTAPAYKLDVVGGNIRASGEIISTMNSGSGQFRAIGGNYGAFIRNDGTSTYIPLITASGDQYGTWNALRPLRINNATGDVYLANGTSIFRHSDGFVGIGTVTPTEKLDVSGNVKFSGALMPNNDPGTAGYLLKSQGAGLPPIWEAPATVPLYGNNASSVTLNSLVTTTNTSAWEDITGITLTFTPEHSTFYIFSSLCARLADNSGMAQFGQAMIQVRVLVNGVVVAEAATTITDYDDVNGVLTSGTISFSGVRASATVGQSTTVKLQWKPVILWASSPWRVEINPTLSDVADHCVLTIFD